MNDEITTWAVITKFISARLGTICVRTAQAWKEKHGLPVTTRKSGIARASRRELTKWCDDFKNNPEILREAS